MTCQAPMRQGASYRLCHAKYVHGAVVLRLDPQLLKLSWLSLLSFMSHLIFAELRGPKPQPDGSTLCQRPGHVRGTRWVEPAGGCPPAPAPMNTRIAPRKLNTETVGIVQLLPPMPAWLNGLPRVAFRLLHFEGLKKHQIFVAARCILYPSEPQAQTARLG